MRMTRATLIAASIGLALTVVITPVAASTVLSTEGTGQSTNISFATAEIVPDAAFTLPAPANVFISTWATATIIGRGGGINVNDVDFFKFSTTGGGALFDVETITNFDSVLSLFDSAGNLIAVDDDTSPFPDSGSSTVQDSFIGRINLAAGTYYIAISQFNNFPTTTVGSITNAIIQVPMPSGFSAVALTRPIDNGFGGYQVSGGHLLNFANGSGPGGSGTYTFNVSLEHPGSLQEPTATPEPSSLALLSIGSIGGIGMIAGVVRRQRKHLPAPRS